jgi:signal transduction histidine kinase
VVENVDRADAMIRDLLDVSRLREGQRLPVNFAPCELNAIVRQAVTHLESMHGDRFALSVHAPIHGFWSEEALLRAIENLANNAIKYGSRDRPVTLTVRSMEGRALIAVHNHGSYIPAEEQGRLFEVFRRSREAEESGTKGWGIGLAQVRGVAEAHHGSISVDSLPERGTTFVIDIPLDPRQVATPGPG